MGRADRALKLSEIWLKSRGSVGVSQDWIAMEIGVSKKTIQNWEKGISSPSLLQAFDWFKALRLNPYPYLMEIIYPELYTKDYKDEKEKVELELLTQIQQMSLTEKKQLLYLMKGNHGSSWHPLLQMFTAHCHTNLKSRVLTANHIVNAYEMDLKTGNMACKEDIQPELDMLYEAVNNAKNSVFDGKYGYFKS